MSGGLGLGEMSDGLEMIDMIWAGRVSRFLLLPQPFV